MTAALAIKSYRKRNNLTQESFGALIPVARGTVARWETDKRKVDRELLPTITAKTGIPAKDLRPDLVELLKDGAA